MRLVARWLFRLAIKLDPELELEILEKFRWLLFLYENVINSELDGHWAKEYEDAVGKMHDFLRRCGR